ncbi:MAG: D-alanyl-D-alanine carboxypeptidase [Firmicutes bacterium]|nr:D-alanyl-D-alanine carboxypeptidase [Bacillota bacterium]
MKRIIILVLVIFLLFGNVAFCKDLEDGLKGVLLKDFETEEILYSSNINTEMSIASITKLMTYLIIMDSIMEGKIKIDDIVTISKNAASEWGSSFNLKPLEKIKLNTLIKSIMIVSANDSCVAVAEHISGSEEKFVSLMNEKAKKIGLNNTKYINSNGLPEKNGQNTMTINDVFKLTKHVIKKYPSTLNITKIKKLKVENRNFSKENTNPLLKEIKDVDGLKTGYTDDAGYCLVSTINKKESNLNGKPFRLIGIVMGAKSKEIRKNKSIELLNYGMKNFEMKKIVEKKDIIKTVEVFNSADKHVDIYPRDDLCLLVKKGTEIKKEIFIKNDIKAPLKKGDKVGRLTIFYNNKAKVVELIVNKDIEKANFLIRFIRYIQNK